MPLRLLKCKVVNASVDWLTCTSSTRDAQAALWNVGKRMLHRGESEGQDTARWHANGYSGWSNGSVSLGARPDGCILRVSGQQASYQWQECIRAAENCSRLDLAVDCQLDTPVTALSREIYRDAGHVRPKSGRIPKRRLIVSSDGGSTVYIGARASEQFGRVYDKGIESKSLLGGLWWRWEVEYKGKSAWAQAHRLLASDDHSVLAMATVAQWFRARTTHSYTRSSVAFSALLSREPTTIERKLSWLSAAVRPTVQTLVERVGRERVLAALGLLPQSAVEHIVPPTNHKECA
jgi:DNA relaxase NicK